MPVGKGLLRRHQRTWKVAVQTLSHSSLLRRQAGSCDMLCAQRSLAVRRREGRNRWRDIYCHHVCSHCFRRGRGLIDKSSPLNMQRLLLMWHFRSISQDRCFLPDSRWVFFCQHCGVYLMLLSSSAQMTRLITIWLSAYFGKSHVVELDIVDLYLGFTPIGRKVKLLQTAQAKF